MESSGGFNPSAYVRTGFSLSEVVELKETFDLFDPGRTGFVNSDTLKSALRILGFGEKNQDIYKVIFGLEGNVDFQRFFDAVAGGLTQEDLQKEADKVFSLFDYDNTGSISSTNLKKLSSDLETPLSDEQLQKILKSSFTDNNPHLSKSDFCNLILPPL